MDIYKPPPPVSACMSVCLYCCCSNAVSPYWWQSFLGLGRTYYSAARAAFSLFSGQLMQVCVLLPFACVRVHAGVYQLGGRLMSSSVCVRQWWQQQLRKLYCIYSFHMCTTWCCLARLVATVLWAHVCYRRGSDESMRRACVLLLLTLRATRTCTKSSRCDRPRNGSRPCLQVLHLSGAWRLVAGAAVERHVSMLGLHVMSTRARD